MFITKSKLFLLLAKFEKVRLHFARLHSHAHRTFTVFEIHLNPECTHAQAIPDPVVLK